MTKPADRIPVLALDIGTATGWAVRDEFGKVTSGTERFTLRKNESYGMRVLRFRSWLRGMLTMVRPGLVVYEQPVLHPKRRARNLSLAHNLEGALLPELEDRGIDYSQPTPAEVKKHATGKGNAGKPAMIRAAIARWEHYDGPDGEVDWSKGDDEADALCVLSLALAELEAA